MFQCFSCQPHNALSLTVPEDVTYPLVAYQAGLEMMSWSFRTLSSLSLQCRMSVLYILVVPRSNVPCRVVYVMCNHPIVSRLMDLDSNILRF